MSIFILLVNARDLFEDAFSLRISVRFFFHGCFTHKTDPSHYFLGNDVSSFDLPLIC